MDDSNASLQPQPANIDMTTLSSTPPVKKTPWILILSLLLIAALAVAGYFYWQNTLLIKSTSIAPSPSPTPVSTVDPTANWKTYTNQVHSLTFKYPTDWQLVVENDQDELNASLKLLKEKASIHMIFGVDGIGGRGGDYEGVPISIAGSEVYKYKTRNEQNGTETVGITDTLTESLGVLTLNQKTYILNLNYPMSYVSSGREQDFEQAFDQILSTFQFTSSENKQTNILDAIQEMTKPMVWSKPVVGSLSDGMDNEVVGTLITAKVVSKEDNKLAQYLVTDTPIVTKYGWKETVVADGIGQSLLIYTKNDQQLIIRMQNGQYNILLSN